MRPCARSASPGRRRWSAGAQVGRATIAAARCALHEGVAAQLGGGTHHAYASKGSGYCIFNDVGRGGAADAGRGAPAAPCCCAWVIDPMCTRATAPRPSSAMTRRCSRLSLHGRKNFPFRKEASDLDVDLPDGCGDAEYLHALDAALAESWRRMALGRAHPGWRSTWPGPMPTKLTGWGGSSSPMPACSSAIAGCSGSCIVVAAGGRDDGGGYGHDIDTTVAVQVRTVQGHGRPGSPGRAGAGQAADTHAAVRRPCLESCGTAGLANARPLSNPHREFRCTPGIPSSRRSGATRLDDRGRAPAGGAPVRAADVVRIAGRPSAVWALFGHAAVDRARSAAGVALLAPALRQGGAGLGHGHAGADGADPGARRGLVGVGSYALLAEYPPFIILLFVAVYDFRRHLCGNLHGGPLLNTTVLAVGGLLASVMGHHRSLDAVDPAAVAGQRQPSACGACVHLHLHRRQWGGSADTAGRSALVPGAFSMGWHSAGRRLTCTRTRCSCWWRCW